MSLPPPLTSLRCSRARARARALPLRLEKCSLALIFVICAKRCLSTKKSLPFVGWSIRRKQLNSACASGSFMKSFLLLSSSPASPELDGAQNTGISLDVILHSYVESASSSSATMVKTNGLRKSGCPGSCWCRGLRDVTVTVRKRSPLETSRERDSRDVAARDIAAREIDRERGKSSPVLTGAASQMHSLSSTSSTPKIVPLTARRRLSPPELALCVAPTCPLPASWAPSASAPSTAKAPRARAFRRRSSSMRRSAGLPNSCNNVPKLVGFLVCSSRR